MHKKKVTKKILTKQEYFKSIKEETNNNVAPKLTRERKSNHKSPIKDLFLSV